MINGDKGILGLVFSGTPLLINKLPLDKDVALHAVRKTPRLYQHLPKALKDDNIPLALAALMNNEDEVGKMVEQVESSCPQMLSDQEAINTIFGQGGVDLIRKLLQDSFEKIDWNQDLANLARKHWPPSYHYFPADFREDGLDSRLVMTSLLKGSIGEDADIDGDDCNGIAKVNEMIAEVPDFFTDRDALHELFREVSDNNVVRQVVKCLTRSIPWDEKLTRLASERCFDYDLYGRDNVTDNEITSIYKESRAHCKYHIPVGMLLSYPVRTAVTEWPDFLNKCRCHLSRDDAALDEAFTFAEHVLKVVDLTSELRSWLINLIRRIKASFHYTRSYQTFRICIFASESSAPLACLKGTDETRIGLKRHVAEYLGTISSRIGMKRNKQDAWKLLCCILIMPMEFPADGFVPESLKEYSADSRGEDTFYCEWCCKALLALDTNYDDHGNNIVASVGDEDDDDGDYDDEDYEDDQEEDDEDEDDMDDFGDEDISL